MNLLKLLSPFLIVTFSLIAGCGESKPTVKQNTKEAEPENQSLVPRSRKAGPVENIEANERIAAARLMEAHDPVAREIKIFDAEIRGAFDEKRFEFLEKTGEELRKSGELFQDGSWKIFRFYIAIDHRFHSGDDGYLTDLGIHRQWEEAFPDSVTRRIALADMLVSYAWLARGSGRAHTVTQEGYESMQKRLNQAARALEDASKLPEKDPYWFSAAIGVGTGQSWDKEAFDTLVANARADFPGYWHLENQRAYTLLPRWYGEEGDWQKFALEASEDPNSLGDETYARVVMRMAGYYGNVFRDAKADWPKMKLGIEALLRKYPESVSLRNWAARAATMGNDQEMAAAIFKQLGDEYIKSVWKKPERFVHFRTWAETGKW